MINISVIIPAFNEADAIGLVLNDIPREIVTEIIVVDNNSTDNTSAIASANGATVLFEKTEQGYGAACLKGIRYIRDQLVKPDIVVFMDGDYSDHGEQLKDVIAPIIQEGFDMVIGSRALGKKEKNAMMPQQIFGNWLATLLLKWRYGVTFTDLGPFRAIRYDALLALNMQDRNYGWTVEMQVKAARQKLKITEVPVDYRRRIGISKVSGTVKGTILAGYKIITTIFKYRK